MEVATQMLKGKTDLDWEIKLHTTWLRTSLKELNSYKDLLFRLVRRIGIQLFMHAQDCIFDVCSKSETYGKGIIDRECHIPGNFLNAGSYNISIIFVRDASHSIYHIEECLHFEVADYREGMKLYDKWMGYGRPQYKFTLHAADAIIRKKN